MAIPPIQGGPQQAPKTEPKAAPGGEPKKPDDNTAAKQSPEETKSAVNNVFGDVPNNGGSAPPADNAKAAAPPADSKNGAPSNQAADPPPSNPAGDAKAPAPASKAAPGQPLKDAQGQPVKTPEGLEVFKNKHALNVAIDPTTGKPHHDPAGKPYAITDEGKYIQTEDGKYGVYDKYGNTIASDPKTGDVAEDADGNAYSVGADGAYQTTPDGNTIVVNDDNGKIAAIDPATGSIVANKDGNPYKLLPDGRFAMADDGSYVAYGGKDIGHKAVAVDPATGGATMDAYGNPLALDDNDKFLKTPDGKDVVYDKTNNGNLAFVDPATGKPATDGSGNPYVVAPDGNYAQTQDGNYVVYDQANGNNPIAIDNTTGQAITDAKGHPMALDENGKYLKTPEGNPVVYTKIGNSFAKVATDESGEPLYFSGKLPAVGKDGAYLKTEHGESVVYDARGNTVALGKDGKVVTDGKGNPLAIDKNGDIIPGAVLDKYTGFKIHDGAVYNADNMLSAFDEDGKPIRDKDGNLAYYDGRGTPVFETNMKTPDGYKIYQDAKTGELEVTVPDGPVYKIDPATNDFAKDANGNPLPALYDPVNSDPTRPPVTMNEDPGIAVNKLPQGTERGDPMKIKDELFDENLNLSVAKLYKALGTYDPRDVYAALIQSGDGVANYRPDGSAFQPDAFQAKQVIAALIAWNNENGQYHPIKSGKVPSIVFNWEASNVPVTYQKNASNTAIINANSATPVTSSTFMALNNLNVSDDFRKNIGKTDIVTEYLANNWTGNKDDTQGEKSLAGEFKLIEDAIMKMGNGDRNAGLDMLKRAYFAGDPLAINALKKHLASTESFLPPES